MVVVEEILFRIEKKNSRTEEEIQKDICKDIKEMRCSYKVQEDTGERERMWSKVISDYQKVNNTKRGG